MLKLRCYRVTVVKLIQLLVPSTSEEAARRHVRRWLDEEDTLADRSIAVIAKAEEVTLPEEGEEEA